MLPVHERITSCAPDPERATVWELLPELIEILSVATHVPDAAGVKRIAIVQDAPAARVAPQVVVSAKSLAFVPVKLMPEIVKAVLLELLNVAT